MSDPKVQPYEPNNCGSCHWSRHLGEGEWYCTNPGVDAEQVNYDWVCDLWEQWMPNRRHRPQEGGEE